jgi:hypothetical protein
MRFLLLTMALLGCTSKADKTEETGYPGVNLPAPNIEGVDFPAAFTSALILTVQSDVKSSWTGHVATIEQRSSGCPDIYIGNPDVENLDDLDEDATGWSWTDYCTNQGGKTFSGWSYWENDLSIVEITEGHTISEVQRSLRGDQMLAQNDSVFFEFDGMGSDALTHEEASGISSWVYSSQLNATVTGEYAFDSSSTTQGGYRAELELYASGGEVDLLDNRGNLYLFETRIQQRFDSVSLDISMKGPTGSGPDDCTAEPLGWIGIRDENAFWYDLVFQPRYDSDVGDTGYENEPYNACDGCGTLYIRGLEQPALEVCMDFSFLWNGTIQPPAVADYVFTMREAGGGS